MGHRLPLCSRRVLPDGLGNGAGPAGAETPRCSGGEVQQVLVWDPNEAWVVFEDPDCRPYVWDLPDGG